MQKCIHSVSELMGDRCPDKESESMFSRIAKIALVIALTSSVSGCFFGPGWGRHGGGHDHRYYDGGRYEGGHYDGGRDNGPGPGYYRR